MKYSFIFTFKPLSAFRLQKLSTPLIIHRLTTIPLITCILPNTYTHLIFFVISAFFNFIRILIRFTHFTIPLISFPFRRIYIRTVFTFATIFIPHKQNPPLDVLSKIILSYHPQNNFSLFFKIINNTFPFHKLYIKLYCSNIPDSLVNNKKWRLRYFPPAPGCVSNIINYHTFPYHFRQFHYVFLYLHNPCELQRIYMQV